MDGHHLILGQLKDFITGETLPDTHDERYRQKLARLLVDSGGFSKSEIRTRMEVTATAGVKRAKLKADLVVVINNAIGLLVKYGPGSLVTRHRPALAMSRLISSLQVPYIVVTNGEDADILEGQKGNVIARSLEKIPDRQMVSYALAHTPLTPLASHRLELEARILYAFEVDGCCPCDDNICKLPDLSEFVDA